MDIRLLLNFALALALTELIHVISESINIRVKVRRLATYMAGNKAQEMPVNVNTRAKSYAISFVVFVFTAFISFFFFMWLDLSLETALKTIIVLLVVSFASSAVIIDQYHVDIEKITKPFKDKVLKNDRK